MHNALTGLVEKFSRDKLAGEPKEKRLAAAKRAYEKELRSAGFSRAQAKKAVAVRFGGARKD